MRYRNADGTPNLTVRISQQTVARKARRLQRRREMASRLLFRCMLGLQTLSARAERRLARV